MYESDVIHLYPNQKSCFVCEKKLKECYRTERSIKTLEGQKDIVCHKFMCTNDNCSCYKTTISPEEENLLALKSKNIGLDVVLEIGRLRYKEHKTWKEVQNILLSDYDIKISERTVGYQEKDYLALINIIAKNDNKLLLNLNNLEGIIIAVDGLKPDSGDEQLYLIREVQTGQILASKLMSYTTQDEIEKLIQEVIDLNFPILGIVSDNDAMQKKAIKNKLPNIPHQICQYHFLKRLVNPLKLEDTKVKKK